MGEDYLAAPSDSPVTVLLTVSFHEARLCQNLLINGALTNYTAQFFDSSVTLLNLSWYQTLRGSVSRPAATQIETQRVSTRGCDRARIWQILWVSCRANLTRAGVLCMTTPCFDDLRTFPWQCSRRQWVTSWHVSFTASTAD